MKQINKFFLVVIFLFTAVLVGSAQTMVSGVVRDSASNEPLPFANVIIKGTTNGTTTDLNGEYLLLLKSGSYTLVASYIGYESMEKEFKLEEGKKLVLDYNLFSESIMGEEIVITGMLRGQKAAISSQLNAAGIVNAVSEEQIQELPDANAGDALGRLPGISLKRSGGEAQNIVLRGLNEKYSMIQLNGVPVPSTGSDSRGVDLSLFSLNSLAGIEVTKALTPDMDADAIAGAVNLVTKKASAVPKLRIDLGGGYNALTNSAAQYNAGLRYNRRMFNEALGIQASVTSERKIRSNEEYSQGWDILVNNDGSTTYQITDLTTLFTNEIRKRTGGSLLFDLSTGDGGTIRFNNFYNRTDRDAVNYSRNYTTDGSVSYKIQDTERDIQTINNALSGENYLGKFKINWGGSYALTVGEKAYDHSMEFTEGGASGTGMQNIPQDLLKGPGELLIPYAYNNFEQAYLIRAYFEPSKSKDRDLIAYLDVERSVTITDKINLSLKAGAKVRDKNRKNVNDVYWSPYWVNQPRDYSLLDDGTIVSADYSNTSFADPIMVGGTNLSMLNFLADDPESRGIFDDKYALNPMLDPDLAREWYATHKNGVSADGSLQEYSPYHSGIMDNYTVKERITAGYAMATLNLGEAIRLIGGVRIETENDEYTAKYAPELSGFLTFDPSTVEDIVETYTSTFVLPNLHMRIKPVKWFDLRMAATKTLARPDFTMRLPTLVVNRLDKIIDRGNTSLNNTEAWNYDIIASFYESQYGLITIGGFIKKMDNIFYMLNDVRLLNSEMASEYNLPEGYGSYVGFIINEPINTNNTEVKGLEFDMQANLKFLPGFMKYFVLRGNFSVIESKTSIPRFAIERDNSVFPPVNNPVFYETRNRMEGQPSKFGNVALGYDRGGFSGRLSVFFQGDYVTSVSASGIRDVMQKGYSKWDLALKQEIQKYNMEIMLNISNISNMYEGTFYEYKSLDQGSSIYGMLIDLGLRITL